MVCLGPTKQGKGGRGGRRDTQPPCTVRVLSKAGSIILISTDHCIFRSSRADELRSDGPAFALQFASMSPVSYISGCGHQLQSYILCGLVWESCAVLMRSANKLFNESRTCPLCEIALPEPDVFSLLDGSNVECLSHQSQSDRVPQIAIPLTYSDYKTVGIQHVGE